MNYICCIVSSPCVYLYFGRDRHLMLYWIQNSFYKFNFPSLLYYFFDGKINIFSYLIASVIFYICLLRYFLNLIFIFSGFAAKKFCFYGFCAIVLCIYFIHSIPWKMHQKILIINFEKEKHTHTHNHNLKWITVFFIKLNKWKCLIPTENNT